MRFLRIDSAAAAVVSSMIEQCMFLRFGVRITYELFVEFLPCSSVVSMITLSLYLQLARKKGEHRCCRDREFFWSEGKRNDLTLPSLSCIF
jgi:hypothetical protein